MTLAQDGGCSNLFAPTAAAWSCAGQQANSAIPRASCSATAGASTLRAPGRCIRLWEPLVLQTTTTARLSSMNSASGGRPSNDSHNGNAGRSSLPTASSADAISISSELWEVAVWRRELQLCGAPALGPRNFWALALVLRWVLISLARSAPAHCFSHASATLSPTLDAIL
eukprot:1601338-Pyramimonas_sp.AAC.1